MTPCGGREAHRLLVSLVVHISHVCSFANLDEAAPKTGGCIT
jgi:hypothetical protein